MTEEVREPVLLKVSEFAEAAGIGRTLAWQLVRSGEIPSVRLGRAVRVPRRVLADLAGEHTAQAG